MIFIMKRFWARLIYFSVRPRQLIDRLRARLPTSDLRIINDPLPVTADNETAQPCISVPPVPPVPPKSQPIPTEIWLGELTNAGDISKHEAALARWYSDYGDVHNHYGKIELAASDYLKANRILGDAFAFRDSPDRRLAMNVNMKLASVMLRQHRHAEAKAFFRSAVDLYPDNVTNQDGCGENIIRHGTADEIREFFESVIAVTPESRMARFALKAQELFPKMVASAKQAASKGKTPERPPAILVMPLWGDAHLRIFLDYVLPLLMEPGNLPALTSAYDIVFMLFTTEECRDALMRHRLFPILEKKLTIQITIFPEELMSYTDHPVGRFQLLQLSHYVAIECARQVEQDVFFVFPDNFVNDRFYERLVRHARPEKVKAVSCAGFRVFVDDILSAADRDYRRPDGTISIPSEGIVRMLYDHLDDSWFVNSKRFVDSPFFLCWRVDEEGLFVRASHFQPYMIRARFINKPLFPTIDPIDAQFLYRHLDEIKDIVAIADEQMCALDAGTSPILDAELSDADRLFDEFRFARFFHAYDTPLHRMYLRVPIKLQLKKSSPCWGEIEKSSDAMLDRVFAQIEEFEQQAPEKPLWAVRGDQRLRDG